MAQSDERKAALIAELDRARSRAAANRRGLSGDAQVSEKLKTNISRHRISWLAGGVLTGLIIAKLPPRTRKVVVDRKGTTFRGDERLAATGKAGIALGAVKLLIDVTKPVLMAWATKRLGEAVHVGKQVQRKVEKVDAKT